MRELKTPNLHSMAQRKCKNIHFANGEIVVMCYMKQLTVLKTNWSMKIAQATTLAGNKNSLTEKLQSLKKVC